jgi:hypothetical protein
MSDVIQYILVALLVLSAAGYVGRRMWRSLQGRVADRCSGCSSCTLSSAVAQFKLTDQATSGTQHH